MTACHICIVEAIKEHHGKELEEEKDMIAVSYFSMFFLCFFVLDVVDNIKNEMQPKY